MYLFLDLLYLIVLPFFALASIAGRVQGHPARRCWKARVGVGDTLPQASNRILIHAVSVGEVNAVRVLVENLASKGHQIVISVTTDTGIARADELFGQDHQVVRYPLDFSWSVKTFLKRMEPSLIVLVELEVWPNMLRIADQKGIPVVVVNGRLSNRSYKKYKAVSFLLRSTFGRLNSVGMQNTTYAQRVQSLGVRNVDVLGTMKWDNAIIRDSVDAADQLAQDLGIDRSVPLIVAGSTTPEEHALLHAAVPRGVQLLVAPRRPEWFDQAEKTFSPCNRRTRDARVDTCFFVLDTIGELTAAYALADLVVIGRSFAPMHGSDPTEPIGLGKPTIIGPNVGDFEDIVCAFLEGDGIIQCTKEELTQQIASLLEDPQRCSDLGVRGRKVISTHQGATARYTAFIEKALSP